MFELLLAFIVWAVVHSLTAGTRAKTFYRRMFGERAYQGTYRLVYNLFSGLTLLPIFYLLATRLPDQVVWSIGMPFRLINYTVQLVGALGLVVALVQTDVWQFLGIRQLVRFLRGHPEPETPAAFIATGAYGLVRHPLYLFSLLFLWANPVMTLTSLAVNLWVTIYFYIGSIYEERRLMSEFGDAYRHYQADVPRLLPLRGLHRHASAAGK